MTVDQPRLPFTHKVTAKGRVYWFFRSKETGQVRLQGDPTTSDFHKAYGEALAMRDRLQQGGPKHAPDSFAALIAAYLESAEYRALADSTQLDYSNTCALISDQFVDPDTGASLPFRYTTRTMIKALRDDYADTVRKANKIVGMFSVLYSWAEQSELVPERFNPAAGLKKLKRKGGAREYTPWSDPEISWVLADAPLHVATPIMLALYTGQRREDVVNMTWQQDQGEILRVRTSKTRELVDMPCHPVLRAHLDMVRKRAKVVSLTGPICLGPNGKPYSVNAMSGQVRRQVQKHPRVPNNRSMHGLRYAAAGRMEEGGATVAAIEAVLGHRTFRMALKYAGARRRAAEGVAAMKGKIDEAS